MIDLIIVAGASGAGKTFFLESAFQLEEDVEVVKKITTRQPRPYETNKNVQIDLVLGKTLQDVRSCDFRYKYADEFYGFNKAEIEKIRHQNKIPIIIVRDIHVIQALKDQYSRAIAIYIQPALSGEDLSKKLESQGRTDVDIEERMRRTRSDTMAYLANRPLFDDVLVNTFDSDEFVQQAKESIKACRQRHHFESGYVFLIMAFNKEMEEAHKAYVNAGKMVPNREFVIERVDDRTGDYKINDEIIQCIKNAECIICDLTMERPNVYFELGFARGIGKRVISTAKAGTKLHFDISDYQTFFYENIPDLQNKVALELSNL